LGSVAVARLSRGACGPVLGGEGDRDRACGIQGIHVCGGSRGVWVVFGDEGL
jgi:hypothetical protein